MQLVISQAVESGPTISRLPFQTSSVVISVSSVVSQSAALYSSACHRFPSHHQPVAAQALGQEREQVQAQAQVLGQEREQVQERELPPHLLAAADLPRALQDRAVVQAEMLLQTVLGQTQEPPATSHPKWPLPSKSQPPSRRPSPSPSQHQNQRLFQLLKWLPNQSPSRSPSRS